MNKHYNKVNYQGINHDENSMYFEGWYFKQVSGDGRDTISFIPGISYNDVDPHCFIQCIYLNDRKELSTYYMRFEIGEFRVEENPFTVRIGDCIFAKDYLVIYFKTPENYIWLQCNHFDYDNVSLICSIAKIPFSKLSFQGFFCNLIIDNQEYRFATYNNSKVKIIQADENSFNIMIVSKEYKLQIKGKVKSSQNLIAPERGAMINTIKEGISGEIQLIMKDKNQNIVINSRGKHCGIEVVNQ